MGLFGLPQEWFLMNHDSGEQLQGQFVAENVNENIGATYAERFPLNSQFPIMQFVHGNNDTVSFNGRFFRTSELFGMGTDPYESLALLKSWARRDDKTKRPPLLMFWIGDAHVGLHYCVIEQISGIAYAPPTAWGVLRDVTFTVELRRWEPWALEVFEPPETRYHHARSMEYYELLALREYGSAMMGDIIRKRHPAKPFIQIGDIVKLPSADAIAKDKVEPKSLALYRAFGRNDTPTKRRRQQIFDARNQIKNSFVVTA